MRSQFLSEYEAIEEEITKKNLQKVADLIDNQKSPGLNWLEFYPEFQSTLRKKVYTNSLFNDMLLQMPFFDAIICPIFPIENLQEFKLNYGISYENFVDLINKQKILPFLYEEPKNYLHCDYMLPLLESKPPCHVIRLEGQNAALLYRAVRKETDISKNLKELSDFFPKGTENLRKRFSQLSSAEDILKSYKNPVPWTEQIIELSITTGYAGLFSKILKSTTNINKELLSILFLTYTYAIPALSLGGTTSIARRSFMYEVAPSLQKIIKLKLNREVKLSEILHGQLMMSHCFDEVFPLDIARVLSERFPLYDFRDIGYKKVIELSHQTDKARKVLYELDSAVKNRQATRALDRASALNEIFQETNETIESMVERREKIKPVIPIVFGVVGGIVGSLGSLPSLLGGALGGAVGSVPLSDNISDALSK